MRFCMPIVSKSFGLGNALIPWAKAFIASSELDIPILAPIWRSNRRAYARYFKIALIKHLYQTAVARSLPSFTFREADFVETGETDYASAIRVYLEQKGLDDKSSYILRTEGLWGGFYILRKAKPFVLATLFNTPYTVSNLYDCAMHTSGSNLNIAVHIRLGDFKPPQAGADYRGKWNTSIPIDWYMNTCRSLKELLGQENIKFILLSDSFDERLRDFIDEFKPITTAHRKNTDCSDLLLMANADLLVCSISSYSMWGTFLSNSPYIWYKPNLYEKNGCLSIWGKTVDTIDSSPHKDALPRGFPVDNDGAISEDFIRILRMNLALKTISTDLINSGGINTDTTVNQGSK